MPKKIVIIGPESTGKSTIAKELAEYFDCPWVPEYAREYIEKLDRPYEYDDLLEIAKGQIQSEDMLLDDEKEFIICDTDLNVIKVWSMHRFGKVDPWILEQIKSRKYDCYLLTDIDIPWQEDAQREHPDPEMRSYFFEWYLNIVSESGIPFHIISGEAKQRLSNCIEIIKRKS
jgi:NadR type nicotinamide-nucleotide adenylyltransferase